jgi:hypothetical protein
MNYIFNCRRNETIETVLRSKEYQGYKLSSSGVVSSDNGLLIDGIFGAIQSRFSDVLKEEYEATAIASFRSWSSERKEGIL